MSNKIEDIIEVEKNNYILALDRSGKPYIWNGIKFIEQPVVDIPHWYNFLSFLPSNFIKFLVFYIGVRLIEASFRDIARLLIMKYW